MVLMLVSPLPVLSLAFLVQPVVIHIGLVALLQPVVVRFILPLVPIAILLVLGIVNPVLPFFLLMALVIILRSWYSERPDRRH